MDLGGTDSGDDPLPTSPTGRIPQWVLDEMIGATPSAPAAPPPPPAAPAPRRRRRAGMRVLLVVVLVLLLGVGGDVLVGPHLVPWSSVAGGLAAPSAHPVPPDGMSDPTPAGRPPVAADPDRPTAGHDEARLPRGHPLPPPPGGGPYKLVSTQADGVTPVAYDPCRPVHYVVRPDGAPPGGEELITSAIARVSQVTGLQFVYDGPTEEPSTRGRGIFQPGRYGDRWAPVLVAWETDVQNPELAGDVVGEGGSTAVSLGDGPQILVTGTLSLDAGEFPSILRRRHGTAIARAIVLHELGHLVGLGHVDDVHELMYPETRGNVLDYAAGDLTGLAAVGSGPCVPAL